MLSLPSLPHYIVGVGVLLGVVNALVKSLQTFHIRNFGYIFTPDGAVTFMEAVTGLVIESVFIAMLVQRLRPGNGG
jgi:hypothetical protein